MWKVQSFISNEVFLRAIAVKIEYVEDSTKTKPKDQTSQEFDWWLPKIAQSRHAVETGEHQDMQPNGVEKGKSSSIPAKE